MPLSHADSLWDLSRECLEIEYNVLRRGESWLYLYDGDYNSGFAWFIYIIVSIHSPSLMIFNLEELHYNLKSLIHELSDMHHRIINPITAKKHNQSSLLIKIPKVILFIKISPFLEYNDVIILSSTCVAMRKIVYSPIGFKLLNIIHSPYPIVYKEIVHSH